MYAQPTPGWAELFLDRWSGRAIRSRLEPMKSAARTIQRYREGILRWFHSKIANGLIESINSLVQAAKVKARGDRSSRAALGLTLRSRCRVRYWGALPLTDLGAAELEARAFPLSPDWNQLDMQRHGTSARQFLGQRNAEALGFR